MCVCACACAGWGGGEEGGRGRGGVGCISLIWKSIGNIEPIKNQLEKIPWKYSTSWKFCLHYAGNGLEYFLSKSH